MDSNSCSNPWFILNPPAVQFRRMRCDIADAGRTLANPAMRTFSIQTLGCKVNQYESEQLATLLRSHGLVQVDDAAEADLRVVNTCSVTSQAAGKSRQLARRSAAVGAGRVTLPVLPSSGHTQSGLTHPAAA